MIIRIPHILPWRLLQPRALCICLPRIRDTKPKALGLGTTIYLIDFSNFSLLPVNPKIGIDDPHILSRTRRDGREKYDVVAASKKRQHSGEEKPPTKRQKKIIEEVESTTKAKSIRKLTPSLHKTVSESKQETKRKVTKSVDARAITTTKVTKPEKSITGSLKECLHETRDEEA
ncbi:unnamed protein product [Arabidopsis halleri]